LSKQVAVSLEDKSVKVVYASYEKGRTLIQKTSVLKCEELDSFLKTAKFPDLTDGGIITISTDKVESAPGEGHLQITLADAGCGIPKDRIEKVFDPFYTTKDSSGNAGLGLSIAKGIIDKHHGTVQIESESEGGTCVIIALPAGDPV